MPLLKIQSWPSGLVSIYYTFLLPMQNIFIVIRSKNTVTLFLAIPPSTNILLIIRTMAFAVYPHHLEEAAKRNCFYFKILFIYLKVKLQRDRERDRKRPSILWFISQMSIMVRAQPEQSQWQEPGDSSGSPMHQHHPPLLSQRHQKESGEEMEQPGPELLPIWDISIAGSSSTCPATLASFGAFSARSTDSIRTWATYFIQRKYQ